MTTSLGKPVDNNGKSINEFMSDVITVINMKGGVGKTTLSVNLAHVLCYEHDLRVLLVDIDPQFNATQYLVKQATILDHFKNRKTVYDILVPNREEEISLTATRKPPKDPPVKLADYVIQLENYDDGSCLHLLPSSLKLINFEEQAKRGTENLLKKFLTTYCGSYEIVIIDCPPTLSTLTLSAYLASDYYLIPIKPDYLSSLGLPLLERGLGDYRDRFGHSITLLGIVFTMKDNRGTIASEVMRDIRGSGWNCFDASSSLSVKVARSTKSLHDFYKYASNSRYSDEFKAIAKELLKKI